MSARDTLHLKFAKRHVKYFEDESKLMKDHRAAMDCFDCEALLQLGIDAFDWLVKADQMFRKAVFCGKAEHDPKFEQAIETLFRAWIAPCEVVNKWIAQLKKRGYEPENLAEFRKRESEVRAMVRFLNDDVMTDGMRGLRDDAVAEHQNGETAEFV